MYTYVHAYTSNRVRKHTNPNASKTLKSRSFNRKCSGQNTNDYLLKCPEVPMQIHLVISEIDNRVHN